MNKVIEEIFQSGTVKDENGNVYNIHSNINLNEGKYLSELIESDQSIIRTLEIGCAYGISSMFICEALANRKNRSHLIIDPCQSKEWNAIGMANLKRAGFDFFELIEKPSEFVLPKLAESCSGTFDLIFIDGWHTFDHTLLDIYYANLLIRVGGYIVIDDCNWASVSKAVSYLSSYPAYIMYSQVQKELGYFKQVKKKIIDHFPDFLLNYCLPKIIYDRIIRMRYAKVVALKKIKEDNRNWDWFIAF